MNYHEHFDHMGNLRQGHTRRRIGRVVARLFCAAWVILLLSALANWMDAGVRP